MSKKLIIKKTEKTDVAKMLWVRVNPCNKGTFGYTALIGGSREYSGAAKLANIASAALRSGTGVVKLAVPESIIDGIMPYILESTLFIMPDKDGHIAFNEDRIDKCLSGTKAIALGMGIGQSEDVEKIISYTLNNYEGIAIIDADGINVLSRMDPAIIDNAKCRVILTPHLKEFSRLTGMTIEEINVNPIATSAEYAKLHKCIVLLKGPTTVVTDGSTVHLVDRGCPGMATAGSGDVLSGILAAICGYNTDELLSAVSAAAYINGAAGELAQKKYGDISMIASDTVSMIPMVLKELRPSE